MDHQMNDQFGQGQQGKTLLEQSAILRRDKRGRSGHALFKFGGFVGLGPRGYQRADERIYEEVCERLTYDPDVDASDIEVIVSSGQVTLLGTVSDRRQKYNAEDAIEFIAGVRDIQNRIKVRGSTVPRDPTYDWFQHA
jgi:hypothetical protein